MKTIPLTHGKIAIVDDDDFDKLSKFKWHLSKRGYAARTVRYGGRCITIYMALEVLMPKEGFKVDHKNLDTLDNRKENLRHATDSQQAWNRKKRRDSTTGFKGVERRKRGFVARIAARGKRFNLGTFDTAEMASEAYASAAIRLHGEFSRTK